MMGPKGSGEGGGRYPDPMPRSSHVLYPSLHAEADRWAYEPKQAGRQHRGGRRFLGSNRVGPRITASCAPTMRTRTPRSLCRARSPQGLQGRGRAAMPLSHPVRCRQVQVKRASWASDLGDMSDAGRGDAPGSRAYRWTTRAIRAQGASSPGRGVAIVAGLLGLSWLVSYVLGGAGRVPPHWFYIPILLAAARFGLPGAAATAVVVSIPCDFWSARSSPMPSGTVQENPTQGPSCGPRSWGIASASRSRTREGASRLPALRR